MSFVLILKVIDMIWDETAKRRIYGPKDVAKAAKQLGIGTMYLNADSYAQFASCKRHTYLTISHLFTVRFV
jgi:hypothetical protein